MIQFMQMMKDFQDNGGIVLAILLVGAIMVVGVGVIRALDWLVWHRELRKVARGASKDVGQHELNYHFDEALQRATMARLEEMKELLGQQITERKGGAQ